MTRNQYDPAFADMKDDYDAKTKQCRKCLEVKPFDAFSRCIGGKFQLQAYCRGCCAKQGKYVYAHRVRRTYGVSEGLYNLILDYQGGKCAICRKEPSGKFKNLSVDHDHTTKKVRGLLCNNCNRGLGLLGDTVERLEAAIRYIKDE